jgi:hypothetical protein
MIQHRLRRALLGALLLSVALEGSSQTPSGKPNTADPSTADRSTAKPTNLRVLPKDSTAADVKDVMERYNEELGVSCDYCHTRNPTDRKLDYVSDENPAKQTARVMIAMLNEINTRYLAQLDDQKYAVLVSCGNCHRGRHDPPEFEPEPRAVADSDTHRK